MLSKIIKKEKERQKLFLKMKMTLITTINCHKQSLINLKEYMEGENGKFEKLQSMIKTWHVHINEEGLLCSEIDRVFIKETQKDIEELNKMIERY